MPRERVEKVLELVGMHQRLAVTIVSRERRVAHGPVAQVLASQGKGEYRVRGHARAAAILAQAGGPDVRRGPLYRVIR